MDDYSFLTFSEEFKKALNDPQRNKHIITEAKEKYKKDCLNNIKSNMLNLEKCIHVHTKDLIQSKPYDITFHCWDDSFDKLPEKPIIDQGCGNILTVDDMSHCDKLQYIEKPLKEIGILHASSKFNNPDEWIKKKEDIINAVNNGLYKFPEIIPKNTYTIFNKKSNTGFNVVIRMSNIYNSLNSYEKHD